MNNIKHDYSVINFEKKLRRLESNNEAHLAIKSVICTVFAVNKMYVGMLKFEAEMSAIRPVDSEVSAFRIQSLSILNAITRHRS